MRRPGCSGRSRRFLGERRERLREAPPPPPFSLFFFFPFEREKPQAFLSPSNYLPQSLTQSTKQPRGSISSSSTRRGQTSREGAFCARGRPRRRRRACTGDTRGGGNVQSSLSLSLSLPLSLSPTGKSDLNLKNSSFLPPTLLGRPFWRRYVFLLYRQQAPLGSSAKAPKSRARFPLKDYAKTQGLEAVDATFFSTSADEE